MCDNFEGFVLHHSAGGGTGSGLMSLLTERLSVYYGKKLKIAYTVWPSPKMSTSVIEEYNAILYTHSLIEHVDMTMMLDNEQLYKIC